MTADQPVVVLLGAGRGGRGVAAALAGSVHLVVVDRDPGLAGRAASVAEEAGGTAEPASVDLLDLGAVTAFRDDLLARHGRVDAVVHLVGGWQGSATVDADAIEAWNTLVGGILTTLQTTSVVFREALAAAPAGRYVMISSTAVDKPTAGNAGYASAKAAAEAWVKALGHAFRETSARACIVAVKALVDEEMRTDSPGKSFAGFTDTRDLGATIAGLLMEDAVDPDPRTAARVLGPTVAS